MADAVVIGRVAVKVYPDTKGFKRDLKEDLTRIEKSLRAIKIEVKLNDTGLAEKAKAVAEKAQKAAGQIKIPVKFDSQDELSKVIRDIDQAIENDRQSRRKFKLIGADEIERLKDAQRELVKMQQIMLNPNDQNAVAKALADVDRELEKRRLNKVPIQFSPKMNVKELSKVRRQLEKLKRLEVEYHPGSASSIRRAFQTLDDEIKKRENIKLSVGLDFPSLVQKRKEMRELLEAQEKIEAAAKAEEDVRKQSLAAIKDTDRHMRSVVDQFRQMQKLSDHEKIVADALRNTEAFVVPFKIKKDKSVDQLLNEVQQKYLRIGELEVNLRDEKDPLHREKIRLEIDKLQDELDELKAEPEVKPEMVETAYRHVQARLAVLSRNRVVQLIPVVSQKAAAGAAATLAALSGGRAMDRVFTDLWDFVKDLDKAVPKIAIFGSALLSAAAGALALTSNVFSLGYALAQIAPLALVLPGLMVGMGIGAGVTYAALKDMNKVLPEVKKGMKELQDAISAKFWAQAKKPIQDFYRNVFPSFREGAKETATEIGKYFGNLSNSFKKVFTPEVMKGLFKGLNTSIADFAKHTDSIANITRILGNLGSNVMPRLAQWAGSIADKFSNWLSVKEASGELGKMVDTAIENFKALGRVIYNIGGIFAGIGRAAKEAGGSSLQSFADTMERIHKAVDSPGFQDGMVQTFKAAHKFMSDIGKRSGPDFKKFVKTLPSLFEDVLGSMGPALGRSMSSLFVALQTSGIQGGVRNLFGGIAEFMDDIRPAFMPLADALGTIFTVVGRLAEKLGGPLSTALGAFGRAIKAAEPFLLAMADLLGDILADAIEWLAPKIEDIGTKVGSWAGKVKELNDKWNELTAEEKQGKLKAMIAAVIGAVGAFQALGLVAPLAGLLGDLNLLPSAAMLAGRAAPLLANPWVLGAAAVVLAIGGIAIGIGIAYEKVDWFRENVDTNMPAIRTQFSDTNLAISDFGTKVGEILTEMSNKFATNATDTETGMTRVQSAVTTTMDTIFTYITMHLLLIETAFRFGTKVIEAIWSIFGDTIMAYAQQFSGGLLKIIEGVMGAIGGVMRASMKAAQGDWSGALEELKGAASSGWKAVEGTFETSTAHSVAAIRASGVDMTRTWGETMDVFRPKAKKGVEDADMEFARLPSMVEMKMGDVKLQFNRMGAEIPAGLAAGIDSNAAVAHRAAERLSAATAALSRKELQVKSPSRVFAEIGRFVAEGLAVGIENNAYKAVRAVELMARQIQAVEIGSPYMDVPQPTASTVAVGASSMAQAATAQAPLHIETNLNGGDLTPEDVADSILFAVRRSRMGGAYA